MQSVAYMTVYSDIGDVYDWSLFIGKPIHPIVPITTVSLC